MPVKRKKKKARAGGIASFARAVASNKALKAAKRGLAKAEARKKKAYRKAVASAKKKFKSKRK